LKYQPFIQDSDLEDRSSGIEGPRKFGGPHPFRLAPVKVGDEYDVRIESMSRKGDSGVARIQGLVVFVSGTKAGDSSRVKVTRIGDGFAVADVVRKDNSGSPEAEVEV
jgi:predicted RNA-binding protein with TRAM domain